MNDTSLSALEASLSFWEIAGYVALASVIICCFAEYLHVEEVWHKEGSWWTDKGGAAAALLLVVALAFELLTQFRTNAVSGSIVAQQNIEAAITEERLLSERRLTANERWRLERVERAVLPRSSYVNWIDFESAIRAGKFKHVVVVLLGASVEASLFASDLTIALQKVGATDGLVDLSKLDAERKASFGHMPSGVLVGVSLPDDQLPQLLWQKFRIGGASLPTQAILKKIPVLAAGDLLVVQDSNWALSAGDGQPGEGVDEYGEADPEPH